jgi:putative ABC transport system permease protein
MPDLGRFARELRARFWKPSVEQEVRAELDHHLERLQQDFVAGGMTPGSARVAAHDKFGDVDRIAGNMRALGRARDEERRRVEWLDELRQDIRYAGRQLRANPRFTIVAVLTLALGLGASTTIFGIADAVLLRPLPFHEPDRLVMVFERTAGGDQFSVSEPNFLDWQRRSRHFSQTGAFVGRRFNVTGAGDAERLGGAGLTHTAFALLGVTPALGRPFTADEDRRGGDTLVAVISDRLWRRRFAADPGAVGRSIELDGVRRRILGVMPAGFDFPGESDIWVPIAASTEWPRGDRRLEAMLGRLAPGATQAQASDELARIAKELEAEYPASNAGWGAQVLPFSDWYVSPELHARVLVLLATVVLLLGIACVNVASLLLARASTRASEMAVRAALGAGRGRIVRQLLTESLVLSAVGGAIGVGAAAAAVPVVRATGSAAVPLLADMSLDWRVLGFALGACVLTGLVFGLAPAVRMSRAGARHGDALHDTLRSGTRLVDGGRLRGALIVASVALAMVMLVGAALVGGSFLRLMRVNLGFAPEQVLTGQVALPAERYTWQQAIAFFDELQRRIAAVPGVRAVGAANIAPFSGGNTAMGFTPPETAPSNLSEYRTASWRIVTPGYFGALGIPLLRGRTFDQTDDTNAPDRIVISETMARLGWPGRDPIGLPVKLGNGQTKTIIGIVADARIVNVDTLPWPTMYFAEGQFPSRSLWLGVRATGDPMALAAAVRREVQALDPNVPFARAQPLTRLVSDTTAEPRLTMLVFAIFATAALGLAAVGLFGLVSYTVAQRTREIGVRLALGAPPAGIVRGVLRQGLRLALAGIALGGIAAYAVGGALQAILYETRPTDPATFAGVAVLLLVVGAAASAVPARRAAKLDPVIALRND